MGDILTFRDGCCGCLEESNFMVVVVVVVLVG